MRFKPVADRIMDLTSIVPITGCWMCSRWIYLESKAVRK